VTAKTVNKEIPGLIPVWEVQQAFPIDSHPIPEGTEFWLTQKLNGTRATFHQGRLRARSGAEYKGLDHITNEINFVALAGFVLDGELTLREKGDLSDNEAFREATGIINSENVDKTTICYTIFDIIPSENFDKSQDSITYSTRRIILDELDKSLKKDNAQNVSVLPVLYHGTDQNQIPTLLDKMVEEDKEGLMVNLDVPYKRKRHSGILKVKRFYTMDLPIIRCVEGTGRLEGMLGAMVVDFKGNEVGVGTGFSDEQRVSFWNDRDNLVGKLCEIKYKEVSSDKKTGEESLQFPVFVGIRDDKTEVSYG
jgi:DNA ligase-1